MKAVQKRGKANAGDKSMLDALLPALAVVEGHFQDSLQGGLRLAAQAAKAGAESTKEMDARVGKARSLGPRALGFVDLYSLFRSS